MAVGSCCDLIDTLHVILLHSLTNTVGSCLIVAGFRVLTGKLGLVRVGKSVGIENISGGVALVCALLLFVKQQLLQPEHDLPAPAIL